MPRDNVGKESRIKAEQMKPTHRNIPRQSASRWPSYGNIGQHLAMLTTVIQSRTNDFSQDQVSEEGGGSDPINWDILPRDWRISYAYKSSLVKQVMKDK